MPVYVFTLGFHADHVIRRLSRARDVEAVYVFTGSPATRAVYNAFQDVVAFCERALLPAPRLYQIPVDDSGLAVLNVLSVLRGCRHVVADVGGGLRGVVVSVVLALVMLSRESFVEVYVYGEREDAPEMYIPLQAVYTVVSSGLSEEKLRILEILSGSDSLDVKSIVDAIGRSERTVRAHLSDLRRFGAITIHGDKVSVTSWGKAMLMLLKSSA